MRNFGTIGCCWRLSPDLGKQLRDHAAYPRLVGLQRMLWTKSRLAIQEATASLHRLREAGIELLLIKGASRLALDDSRRQTAHGLRISTWSSGPSACWARLTS